MFFRLGYFKLLSGYPNYWIPPNNKNPLQGLLIGGDGEGIIYPKEKRLKHKQSEVQNLINVGDSSEF